MFLYNEADYASVLWTSQYYSPHRTKFDAADPYLMGKLHLALNAIAAVKPGNLNIKLQDWELDEEEASPLDEARRKLDGELWFARQATDGEEDALCEARHIFAFGLMTWAKAQDVKWLEAVIALPQHSQLYFRVRAFFSVCIRFHKVVQEEAKNVWRFYGSATGMLLALEQEAANLTLLLEGQC